MVGAVAVGVGTVAGVVGGVAAAGAKALLGAVRGGGGGGNNDNRPPPPQQQQFPAVPATTAAATAAATRLLDAGAARRYTYEELSRATSGFSPANLIGRGGYGGVYRGTLDGVPVAVKTLDTSSAGGAGGGNNNAQPAAGRQGVREFETEVAILSRLHHPHCVLLIGACPEACMLVYEQLDWSLEQVLRPQATAGANTLTSAQPPPALPWHERVRVAAEVAAALSFLHSASPPIVHLDVKPGNVLLTAAPALRAKLSDVGLSRILMQQPQLFGGGGGAAPTSILDSRLVGSPSYVDPEYARSGRFSVASDTYSFGVVLLQLLSGRDASAVIGAFESAMDRARRSGGRDTGPLQNALDPRAGSWPITEALALADLAVRCAALSRADRPDLRGEVLPALLQLKQRAALYAQSGAGAGAGALARAPSLPGGVGPGGGGSGAATALIPPSVFICPISQDVMCDPVVAADGYTYERDVIAAWMARHDTSPMTGLRLEHKGLTANLALRSAISEWRERTGQT